VTTVPASYELALVVRDLAKAFEVRGTFSAELRRTPRRRIVAIDGISLEVDRREVLGLVGESGSGKTTLARTLVRLVEPDAGTATFLGMDVFGANRAGLRAIRRRMQLIYQDPYQSLDPMQLVGDAIAEPARVHRITDGRASERALVGELLESVGLRPSDADRFPRQLSGGQRQRVAIARALAVQPEMLIADEAVSALDVSVQAQIINLFADLAQERHLAMIFVSHQLAVVAKLAHRVAIMYLGRIVEVGRTQQVFRTPRHPYTAALLAAHPDPQKVRQRQASALRGELPSADAIPAGCRFRSRCPMAQAICETIDPPPVDLGDGHLAWCHFAGPTPISIPRPEAA
jgi:oligopeptide/dipeptide ABC transporter ATP-binding protein